MVVERVNGSLGFEGSHASSPIDSLPANPRLLSDPLKLIAIFHNKLNISRWLIGKPLKTGRQLTTLAPISKTAAFQNLAVKPFSIQQNRAWAATANYRHLTIELAGSIHCSFRVHRALITGVPAPYKPLRCFPI